jgi:hypothetical protein
MGAYRPMPLGSPTDCTVGLAIGICLQQQDQQQDDDDDEEGAYADVHGVDIPPG